MIPVLNKIENDNCSTQHRNASSHNEPLLHTPPVTTREPPVSTSTVQTPSSFNAITADDTNSTDGDIASNRNKSSPTSQKPSRSNRTHIASTLSNGAANKARHSTPLTAPTTSDTLPADGSENNGSAALRSPPFTDATTPTPTTPHIIDDDADRVITQPSSHPSTNSTRSNTAVVDRTATPPSSLNSTPSSLNSAPSSLNSAPSPFNSAPASVYSSYTRLYSMTYFPSAFWPRYVTRLLADSVVSDLLTSLYPGLALPPGGGQDVGMSWHCWQNGIELLYNGVILMRIREVDDSPHTSSYTFPESYENYKQARFLIQNNNNELWSEVDFTSLSLLEVITYSKRIAYKGVTYHQDSRRFAAFFEYFIDSLDTLLEDWFPDIGSRFAQDSRGAYLITRMIPCWYCMNDKFNTTKDSWEFVSNAKDSPIIGHYLNLDEIKPDDNSIYCHLVEKCATASRMNRAICCPRHSVISPLFIVAEEGTTTTYHIAPDTMFLDLPPELIISHEHVTLSDYLGRGSFGSVYSGLLRRDIQVALKYLEPKDPGSMGRSGDLQVYKRDKQKWETDILKSTWSAYTCLRRELKPLLHTQHRNIIKFYGICISQPFCIVLALATGGNLRTLLDSRADDLLPVDIVYNISIQIANALTYLHDNSIIYRDLKSENVLIMHFGENDNEKTHVVLADYGVSRFTSSRQVRGLAGTLVFMAPEILAYNGEQSYNDKVDTYSYAMFLYELLTCHLPYRLLSRSNIDLRTDVISGSRPCLEARVLERYPCRLFDLMTWCWARDPRLRPRMSIVGRELSRHCFLNLRSCTSFGSEDTTVTCCTSVSTETTTDVWIGYKSIDINGIRIMCYNNNGQCAQSKVLHLKGNEINRMCVVDKHIWCDSKHSDINVYSSESFELLKTFTISQKSQKPHRIVTADITIVQMVYCQLNNEVCIALSDGSFIICESRCVDDMASFTDLVSLAAVKTTCPGNGQPIFSLACYYNHNGHYELWAGQSQTKLSIWELDAKSGRLKVLKHPCINEKVSNGYVSLISNAGEHMLTYLSEDSRIFRWSTKTKKIYSYFDLKTIEHNISTTTLQSLVTANSVIYACLHSGQVVLLNLKNMTFICRETAHFSSHISAAVAKFPLSEYRNKESVIIIGGGYDDFIKEYHPKQYTNHCLCFSM